MPAFTIAVSSAYTWCGLVVADRMDGRTSTAMYSFAKGDSLCGAGHWLKKLLGLAWPRTIVINREAVR